MEGRIIKIMPDNSAQKLVKNHRQDFTKAK